MKKTGVLLVNLGTPTSFSPRDVKRYLNQFLTDPRVIDIPYLLRQFLVRLLIVPKRYKESAALYRTIWDDKKGSPLFFHSQEDADRLQHLLGDTFDVRLAMRYQNPSIESVITHFQGVKKLVVLPLFPQYASATTGSIHEKILKIVASWTVIPEVQLISSYFNHPHGMTI